MDGGNIMRATRFDSRVWFDRRTLMDINREVFRWHVAEEAFPNYFMCYMIIHKKKKCDLLFSEVIDLGRGTENRDKPKK